VLTSTYSRVPHPAVLDGQDDAYYDKQSKPKLTESKNHDYEITKRCGLICDCSIWNKRKKDKEADESSQSEDGDESEIDHAEASIQGQIQDGGQTQDGEETRDGEQTQDEGQIQDSDNTEHAGRSMHEKLSTVLLTYKHTSEHIY
jgi:hypothetical protein